MKEGRTLNLRISTSTLLKIVAVLVVLYLLYLVLDVVAVLFASLILASAIEPLVKSLAKLKIHRALGIILIYLILLTVVGLAIYLIIPPIVGETKDLGNNLPIYFNRISNFFFNLQDYTQRYNWPFDLQAALNNLSAGLQTVGQDLVSAISGIFGGIFSFILVLVITFYMIMEETAWKKSVKLFLPGNKQARVTALMETIQEKIGWWFRGQLALCAIIFLMTYMSLSIFGIKYALVLALIAGIFEIIPYLGPTLSAVPAVLVTFVQSPILALFILLVYIIIQSVENNILVPKIMQRAVGLDPIVSIIVLMVGFKLGGVMGAILAIPLTTALTVIIKDLFLNRQLSK